MTGVDDHSGSRKQELKITKLKNQYKMRVI